MDKSLQPAVPINMECSTFQMQYASAYVILVNAADLYTESAVTDDVHCLFQEGEIRKFIDELLGTLPQIVCVLENHQVHAFYEAVGLMISAEWDLKAQEMYLVSMVS